MLLCLDAGNTRLKYGLCEGVAWRAQGALEYASFDALENRLPVPPTRIVACNVAGEQARQRIEALAAKLRLPLDWLSSSPAACGISNGYDAPQQLGADRWAALIGARALHCDACVVVLAGTATTVDVLDAGGRFLGGLILPGLALMRSALASNTADLPHAVGHFRALASNTDDAIVSGALHATLGAIERVRAAQPQGLACLLSGGAAADLVPHLAQPCRVVEHLVLEGLAHYGLTR
ncbi:MAG: type III pantothenate kinase [Rhodocyclales bacterium]|nr:type III pantothenate kinase [Rhodocyclales bacterium]